MFNSFSKVNKPAAFLAATTLLAGTAFFAFQSKPSNENSAAPAKSEMFAFVRSLEGTKSDGDLKVAAGDKLVVDAELARSFDYFLSAMGESR